MGYASKTLAPNEKVLGYGRFHWIYDVQSVFWLGFGLFPVIFWGYLQANVIKIHTEFLCFSLFVAALSILYVFMRYIHKWATEIVVSSDRLIVKHGAFSRDTEDISVEVIDGVDLVQSRLGRFLNYGVLTVRVTNYDDIILPPLRDPLSFQKVLETAVQRYEHKRRKAA